MTLEDMVTNLVSTLITFMMQILPQVLIVLGFVTVVVILFNLVKKVTSRGGD